MGEVKKLWNQLYDILKAFKHRGGERQGVTSGKHGSLSYHWTRQKAAAVSFHLLLVSLGS